MRIHSHCTRLAMAIIVAGTLLVSEASAQQGVVIEESSPQRSRATSTPQPTTTPAAPRASEANPGISIEPSSPTERRRTTGPLNVVTTSGIRLEESTGEEQDSPEDSSEPISVTAPAVAPRPTATPEPPVYTPASTQTDDESVTTTETENTTVSDDDATTAPSTSSESESDMTTSTPTIANKYPLELPEPPAVRLGNEVLFENEDYTSLIRGKRVGLITNPTGVDSKLISTIDKLAASTDWKLTALYGPEHGIRGAQSAGENVDNEVDEFTSTPIYSLYGKDKDGKSRAVPGPEVLENVDVLIYDLQDIGNRSYTYVATLKNCMTAAKAQGIPILVLDRPNPMGGDLVDGNVLDEEFESFVGWAPVAYLYGMTCGETAKWLNEKKEIGADLTVVPMEGWKRDMKWWDTGLPWVATSTHMQRPETCWYIAITGTFGELHSVNEGVGYTAPFEMVAAPWIDGLELSNELNSRKLPGLYFRPVYYKPFYGTHKDTKVSGVHVMVLDFELVRPIEASMHIIESILKLYPEADMLKAETDKAGQTRVGMFNKVMGTDQVRNGFLEGKTAQEIINGWQEEQEQFVDDSSQYYMYD